MSIFHISRKNPSRVKKYTLSLVLLWTIVIISSLSWNYISRYNGAEDAARVAARAQFYKDVIYRRWNAEHGGVYVPISESTQPNPYLTEVEKRDMETTTGIKLTLMNPAYMTRKVHELGLKTENTLSHITSLKPIRPDNEADPWEKSALMSFEQREQEFSSIELIDGDAYMRLMRPLITERSCLKCHENQGYKEGDIRGGISISIPMAPYSAIAYNNMILIVLSHLMFWLIGFTGMIFVSRRISWHISNSMKAEEERVKLENELRQAQKMEAIGTLAGGIAHDFNNMLSVIMGYTELSLDDLSKDNKIYNNLKRIMKSSERAKDMVKQILAFSRKSEKNMEPVNIGKVIKETINFLRSSIPATVEIRSNIEKGLGLILGNTTQINQILMNLCTNAAHSMKEEGGLLEIGLNTIMLNKDNTKIKDIEPGIYIHLTVGDSGTGMERELIEHIFEPYFTTKKNGEGTGMGLAVVFGIVKSHRGEIEVYSEPGKGTIFNVYFPILELSNTGNLKINIEPVAIGNNERILFVDDEISLAELGRDILKNLGYQAESRTSSIEALEAFKANPTKFELIVTDMTMPDMTGVKLAKEIHKIDPDIPVIICTGFSDSINYDNYKKQGIDALVMKPVIKGELAKAIKEVLEQKQN